MSAAVVAQPDLVAELARVRQRLALLRVEYAVLLTAARASVAADRDSFTDALAFVRGVLAERGQLPGPQQRPAQILALAGPRALGLTSVAEGRVSG